MAMSPEATKAMILEILQSLLRSWWRIVAALSLGLGAASVLLLHIPKVYESQCTIAVTPPRLPGMPQMFVDDTAQRLATLREEVLSKPYLKTLIEELSVTVPGYELPQDPRDMDRAITRMRRSLRTKVRAKGRLFTLSFTHENPRVASAVLNTLSDLYIQKNTTYRIKEVDKTRAQWQRLAGEKRDRLTARRQEINSFRQANLNALPESLNKNQLVLSQSQRELDNTLEQIVRAEDQLVQLRAQRDAGRTISTGIAVTQEIDDPCAARERELRTELASLEQRYSDKYPAVRNKRAELENFIASCQPPPPVSSEGVVADVQTKVSPIETDILLKEGEVSRLKNRKAKLEADIARTLAWINQTNQNRLQLDILTAGIGELEKEVAEYEKRASAAETTGELEEENQGEQFQVIEAAAVPRNPISPKPFMIYFIGLAAGIGLFVGPLVIGRLLTPMVGSEATLRELSDGPFVFSIPRIPTAATMRMEYWRRVRNLVFAAASLTFLAGSLAYAYTDGRLLQKLMDLTPMG